MKRNNSETKKVFKILGINTFIAVKSRYNESIGKNDFYNMLKRRTNGRFKMDAKTLATFLKHELHFHYKEVAQYQ